MNMILFFFLFSLLSASFLHSVDGQSSAPDSLRYVALHADSPTDRMNALDDLSRRLRQQPEETELVGEGRSNA